MACGIVPAGSGGTTAEENRSETAAPGLAGSCRPGPHALWTAMKIAQVSPLMEAVPPKLYGGTERIVAYLCDELTALGHDVTLFATGDSITRARLEPVWGCALRLDPTMRDYLAPHLVMLEMLARRAEEFDIIHLHVDYLSYPVLRRVGVPFVTTL